jgi:hypothetical protein
MLLSAWLAYGVFTWISQLRGELDIRLIRVWFDYCLEREVEVIVYYITRPSEPSEPTSLIRSIGKRRRLGWGTPVFSI